jgi:hypothetical protein
MPHLLSKFRLGCVSVGQVFNIIADFSCLKTMQGVVPPSRADENAICVLQRGEVFCPCHGWVVEDVHNS